MLYAHSHTFPNSPPLRSRLIFSPPVLARRLNAAPGARGEVSPCPSLPLPTPFRALTGAPSPIRPPKGGSLGDARATLRPPAPWRNPPAHPLPRPNGRSLPHPPPKRGLPGGIPAPLLFPCAFLLAGGQPPGPLVPRPRAGGAYRGRHRSPSDGLSGLVMVQLEFSTLFSIRNFLACFPLLKYDHFFRHSRRRSRCHPLRFHPSKRPSLASSSLPGADAAASGWAQLCALLCYFFINSLNAHRRIFARL